MLRALSIVLGWLYFSLWSFSWYPQIIDNWRRKSVVGLHLDYVTYNIVGHVSYSIFNVALLWFPSVQAQYLHDHPGGVIPVELNDVFFSLHSVFCCVVMLIQCIIYERGGQRVSRLCMVLLIGMLLAILGSCSLSVTGRLRWFDVLYILSAVKLVVTLVKNVPQVWYNYERKSTVGWSAGAVIVDFFGGLFSLLQMVVIVADSGDWGSLIGNPTKLGLGLLSTMFDVIFLMQHFYWYKENDMKTASRLTRSFEIIPPK